MRACTPILAAISADDFRQRLALLEQFRAQQVDREIAVAGVKPDGLSQVAHGLQTKKCVALDAPAAFLAQQPGQYISDGIEVRRNVQSPPFQIVSGIHDDGEIFGRNDLAQAIDKLGAARPAGEYDDHAALSLPA